MDEQQYGQLLDLIYGAAVKPELWVPVIEQIADIMGGDSGWLSQVSMADGNGSGVIARLDPAMPQRYTDYYGGINPFAVKVDPHRTVAKWKPNITTDRTYFEPGRLAHTEFYNDFMRPMEIRHVLMIDVAAKGLEVATVNIHRKPSAGAFDREEHAVAEALHSHLVRAFKLSGVFAGVQSLSNDAAAALDQARHGIFILDGCCRLRHVNKAGERMLKARNGLTVVAGALSAVRGDAARALHGLVGAAASADPAIRKGGSMAIRRDDFGAPLSITVAPLHTETVPIFTAGPSVLVCATDLHLELSIGADRLHEVFGLTAAEVRVTNQLLDGGKPRDAAEALGLSVNTVRVHLSNIFSKTGTASQAELSRLLMRLTHGDLQSVG